MPRPNRIKEIREAKRVTIEGLAELADVSPATISKLENGKMNLTVEYMRQLARALGVAPVELLLPEDRGVPIGLDGADAELTAPPEGERILNLLYTNTTGLFWLSARSDALDRAGIVPGDWLICQTADELHEGDTIAVTVKGETGATETLLRVYRNGFLQPDSHGRGHRILLVDDPGVEIIGRIRTKFGHLPDAIRAA